MDIIQYGPEMSASNPPGDDMTRSVLLYSAMIWGLAVAAFAWNGAGAAPETEPLGPTDGCPHTFDVLHYAITLAIDIENETVSGSAMIRCVAEEPDLGSIDLDFAVLTVDSVRSPDSALAFIHDEEVLTVNLQPPCAMGDTFEIEVFYGGHPGNTGLDDMGGFYFLGVPKKAFQVGRKLGAVRPSMGRYLFPCWDWPCDKATAEYRITIPGVAQKVICNGVLEEVLIDSVANTATFYWVEDLPVATHRMALHAGRYAELVDSTYGWIRYYVYPRQVEDALVNFENVDIMVDALEQPFGPYPFEKCAYVAVSQADVGHQNCITYPAGAVTPTHINDWRVARGLACQWWGACVTIGDWRDVWLCESFKRYGEPLFVEYAYGPEAYHDYVYEDLMIHTFQDVDEHSPIYDPNFPGGHTIYEKGAVVLHMLRYVLGDSTFFATLWSYRHSYEYENATTSDFQAVAEAVSALDLGWFFDEWIYDCGWPEYEYAWTAGGSPGAYEIDLVINQVQSVGPVFSMPVEIGITTVAGDTLLAVWADEQHEEYALTVADFPLEVVIDPNRNILQRSTEVPYAGVALQGAPVPRLAAAPNPSRGGVNIRYTMGEAGHVKMGIYDASGRLVASVFDGMKPARAGDIYWGGEYDSGAIAAPGIYFCRMTAGPVSESCRIVLLR